MRLSDFNKGITYLLTYFPDPGIEKTVPGLQTLLSTVGSRAFPVAAAQTGTLPEHIVSAPTLQSSMRHLKTFLLQQSFCHIAL